MGTVVTILILTGAAAALIKVVSEHISWLERWSWHLSILIALGGVGIAAAQLLSEKKTDKVVQNAVKEAVSPLVCKIDSLEVLIQLQVSPGGKDILYRQLAREQAECIKATVVLYTAMDSGLVALALQKYPEAISHFNYAILSAPDNSAKADGYNYRGLAKAAWGSSLSTVGDYDSAISLYGEAVSSYDSALTCRPGFRAASKNRAVALFALGRDEEAWASCYLTCH